MIRSPLILTLGVAALIAVGSNSLQAQAPHASHRLPAIALDVLERPIPLRTGIGEVHHDASTTSKEAQRLYDQGLAYLHSYVWIDAARSFNVALRIDPQLALAHVGLSVAYVELNHPSGARMAIDKARAIAAKASDHLQRHVEVRTAQMDAEDHPGDAAKLGLYRQALDRALTSSPNDVEFILLRGMAESPDPADRGQGSVAGSVPHYERALALAPGHFAAHHYLAHARENAGQTKEALSHAAAYAARATEIPHARHMHGHTLRRAGRVSEAIAEFEAADRRHRQYAKQEKIGAEYDWHFAHNLGLLATSLQYIGQMKRAETLLKAAFAVPTSLLIQAYNKREWPMFLRSRGRNQEAEAAARTMIADPHPVVQAAGQIELGFALLATNRWGDAANASNAALRLLRSAPGGTVAGNALLALQGEFNLRTAARAKGRASLEEAVKRLRAAQGGDAWSQSLFDLETIARAARSVGDWEFAGRVAREMLAHDPAYAGSHYALALVAEHDGDGTTAKSEFGLTLKYWTAADHDLPELVEARKKAK